MFTIRIYFTKLRSEPLVIECASYTLTKGTENIEIVADKNTLQVPYSDAIIVITDNSTPIN